MDSPFPATREELYHVQMEVKSVQAIQTNHADRLLRLEKRQADDAALKSVWHSPFPSVIGGTPQQGPIPNHSADVFDDFDDEQEQNILGTLNLDADDEPVRRGASRANSVRFDVSAIQGSNWAQSSRNSGEFGLVRPSSGIGSHPMGERSLSHKSDGRHSSAGHSVHSMHSVPSGRTSSLGLDTNFMIGGGERDDESPLDIHDPPPGLFILGSVPSIIRCWLATNFSHDSLLYAVVCTGSQRSLLDYSLVRELELLDQIQKDSTGRYTIRLPVYLTEGIISQPISRSSSPAHQLPALTADFEVFGISRTNADRRKTLRVFLGSDVLRLHNADILFSQNLMTLYADDRNKVSVPFVRPEDEKSYRTLGTTNVPPEKNELKATAIPFTPTDQRPKAEATGAAVETALANGVGFAGMARSTASALSTEPMPPTVPSGGDNSILNISEARTDDSREHCISDTSSQQPSSSSTTQEPARSEPTTPADLSRRDSASGIWGSWRQNSISGVPNGSTEASDHGHQRATRGNRQMKVLKPSKSTTAAATSNSTFSRSSSAARTGASYEPAPPSRSSGEVRRKSQAERSGSGLENVPPQPLRWERGMSESKRSSSDEQQKPSRLIATVPRSSNPIGGASAFAWMNPANSNSGKKGTAAAE